MGYAERVHEGLDAGFNCAESIVAAFVDVVGTPHERLVCAATPFGAGVGCTGNVCGLVSGAAIVLGCAIGRSDPKDVATKERAYAAIRELMEAVGSSAGSILCTEILGADLREPEGRRRASDDELFRTRCRPAADVVVTTLVRLLDLSES